MTFLIHSTTADDVSTVRIRGELDAIEAATVATYLNAAISDNRFVVVDLAAVTFMDCRTLGVLITAARRADRLGGWMVVADPPPRVQRLFDIFDVYPVVGGRRTVAQEQLRAQQRCTTLRSMAQALAQHTALLDTSGRSAPLAV